MVNIMNIMNVIQSKTLTSDMIPAENACLSDFIDFALSLNPVEEQKNIANDSEKKIFEARAALYQLQRKSSWSSEGATENVISEMVALINRIRNLVD